MNKYYVYMYMDPDNSPFYIGKGKGERHRIGGHSVGQTMTARKIRKIGTKNVRSHFLHKGLTEEQAFYWEKYWIRYFGRIDNDTGQLTNHTDGGEGISGCIFTSEHKRKISESNKGKHCNDLGYWLGKERPEETKCKISKTKLGTSAWNKGIPMTKKKKEKISKTKLGTPAWNKGIPCTKETKQKISKTLVGHEPSVGARLNMSIAQQKRREQEKINKEL